MILGGIIVLAIAWWLCHPGDSDSLAAKARNRDYESRYGSADEE
jgi:hypothetical protein